MRTTCFFSLLLLLAGVAPARAQGTAEADYEARLTEVKGDVTVFTAEEPDGVPADQDMPLAPGDRIRTADDSSAEVTFSGSHCVSLRSRSEMTLTSLKRQDSELSLALGSLLAKIQSLGDWNFRVRTPAAVAAVRGTEFAVEVEAEHPDRAHVGVFDEGKVAVTGRVGEPELLKANQETSVERGGRPLPAYQLRRFVRQRQFMRSAFRRRVLAVRQNWRAMSRSQRLARRQQMLARLRQLRQQRQQRLQESRQRTRQDRARLRRQRHGG